MPHWMRLNKKKIYRNINKKSLSELPENVDKNSCHDEQHTND